MATLRHKAEVGKEQGTSSTHQRKESLEEIPLDGLELGLENRDLCVNTRVGLFDAKLLPGLIVS